jgi:hypothetical protein
MTIFVVEGSTGEYSDHREWPVMAYRDEAAAKAHVEAATRRANDLKAQHACDIPDGANEHDPGMQTDYTGTRYYYYAVELR